MAVCSSVSVFFSSYACNSACLSSREMEYVLTERVNGADGKIAQNSIANYPLLPPTPGNGGLVACHLGWLTWF